MPNKLIQRAFLGSDEPREESRQLTGSSDALRSEPLLEDASLSQVPVSDDLRGQVVYILDAHALIFQVFHALPEMSGPLGQPVNAIYGFTRDVLYVLEKKKPDFLLCAFDAPGETFRHQMYEGYKIQREEMPEELRPQISQIRRLLEAMGIPVLELPTYEADDIIATVTRLVELAGGQCYVVTNDKDCRQLITDKVKIYNLRKDQLFDSQSLLDEWGIRPDQVVDFQALVGDSVDNVPGVPLIGPKIASQLLGQYGTLDNLLEHAEEVPGQKRRQNLIAGRKQVLVSRRLVRLTGDVPITVDWKRARVRRVDSSRVRELFREFGFRSFAEKLGGLEGEKAQPEWLAEYCTVSTPQQLERVVGELSGATRISVNVETTDGHARRAAIAGFSFAREPGRAFYIPVCAPAGQSCLDGQHVLAMLRPILEDPRIEKVGQDLKYDMVALRSAGIKLEGAVFDSMVASYLLDAGQRNHDLDALAKQYLDHSTRSISQLIGSGKSQKRLDEVPVDEVTAYAGEDADVALRLVGPLADRLKQEQLDELFSQLEIPLIEVLAEMEYNGIRIDVDRLQQLSRQYGQRMADLERAIYELAGTPFNISSPRQMAEILFERLNLPVLKKTKTGPSTDVEVLERLAMLHELPAKVIQYRQYAKLKSTYVDALPALVHAQTGRIHTLFHQVVAATGRLSSADPNLQNIPVRTAESREIRSAFLAGQEGWDLVTADYSQIELRVLAHFSGDRTLCDAFLEDQDVHARVASEVYGVTLEAVTPQMRRRAKAINFGVIYGQSPFGLAKSLGIEKEEAAAFIDAYFARYPGVDKFFETILAQCRQNGYVSTILGRRRKVQGVRDPSRRGSSRQRNLPERTAINTVIQGSAADLIKLAMIKVHRRLRSAGMEARMLLQIHDELVFEVPSAHVGALSSLVVAEMSEAYPLAVPLKIEVKSGRNWAECETVLSRS